MAVECKGFEMDGVLYDEIPDKMRQKIIKAFCDIHGLKVVEDSKEKPEDPPAA